MLESKQKIIHATIALVHAIGLEHAATAKISKEAGVATGTLFHHFPNKTHLFESVHQYILDDYIFHLMGFFDYPDDKIGKQLKKAIKASIDYWTRNPKYFVFMNQMIHSGYYTEKIALMENAHIEKQLGTAFKTAIRLRIVNKYDYKVLLQILMKTIFQVAAMIYTAESLEQKKSYRQHGIMFIWTALTGK